MQNKLFITLKLIKVSKYWYIVLIECHFTVIKRAFDVAVLVRADADGNGAVLERTAVGRGRGVRGAIEACARRAGRRHLAVARSTGDRLQPTPACTLHPTPARFVDSGAAQRPAGHSRKVQVRKVSPLPHLHGNTSDLT